MGIDIQKIKEEWRVVKKAPLSFGFLLFVVAGLVFSVQQYRITLRDDKLALYSDSAQGVIQKLDNAIANGRARDDEGQQILKVCKTIVPLIPHTDSETVFTAAMELDGMNCSKIDGCKIPATATLISDYLDLIEQVEAASR